MSIRKIVVIVAGLICASVTPPARADDGGIAFGGSPRLLSGHPSISMRNEVVRMTIGSKTVRVDCQFTFRNDGPACKVRMGFPDQARGTMDPEEAGPVRHPVGTFTSYVSFVDGIKAPTELIRADTEGSYWHAKTVTFPAQSTRRVRDVYTVALGGRIIDQGSISEAYYILHTGSSWHGLIGRAEIDVAFAPGSISGPPQPVPLKTVPGDEAARYAWAKHSHGIVLYRGPSAPTVEGRTLRFVRVNFKPAYLDDVLLSFGFHAIHTQ